MDTSLAGIKRKSSEEPLESRKKESSSAAINNTNNNNNDAKETAKPQFLTKAQRQALALEKLEEERKKIQQQREEAEKSRDRLHEQLRNYRHSENRERDRERERERELREKEREREREAAKTGNEMDEKARKRQDDLEKAMETAREKEQQAIRARYLGGKAPKKKVIKVTDKMRFSFDWEPTEDTSRDVNPLYNNRHEAQLLFGRGMKAGIDRREQKKTSTYVSELERLRAKHGNTYDGHDEDDEMDDDDE